MSGMPLVAIATTDLAAITRGRFIPAARLEGADAGVGWLPANLALTPFGTIVDPNPWGSRGDVRLVPDLSARFRTTATGAATAYDLVLGDIVECDGSPWPDCPRTLLRRMVDALHERTGLSLLVAVEQEFQLFAGLPAAHPLSVAALRQADPFASRLMAALDEAGIEPEVVIAEFGREQFEVTHAPTSPVAAADRAIAIREITREIARHLGWQASFSPKTAPDAVGSGVHIHVSLVSDGKPATYEAGQPGGLSSLAARFFAGVMRHLRALVAFSAPSPISYQRLKPHSWSASWTWMADRDREAALRICPTNTIGGRDPAVQYNLEFRPVDASANPYLGIAALIRAGLAGLEEDLAPVPLVNVHPEDLDEAARHRLGLQRLPRSVEESLAALRADGLIDGWLPTGLAAAFRGVRGAEIERTHGLSADDICRLYRDLY